MNVSRASWRKNQLLLACTVVVVGTTAACLDGLKKKKATAEDAGVAAASAPAVAPTTSTSAAVTPDPVDTASALRPEELKLPGACIDTRTDAQKRARALRESAQVEVDNSTDLDGDGKNDRIFTTILQRHVFGWIYVMRGSCGHFVGELPGSDGHKVLTPRSHGLRTIEVLDADQSCAGQDCPSHTTQLFFNGVKFVTGKVKDTTEKCPPGARKPLPKCSTGQTLVAEGEGSPPFCSKTCSTDSDGRPDKCDSQGFIVDEKTGVVFTGVGKSISVCGRTIAGVSSTTPPPAEATVLAVPPGSVAVIPNPKGLDCPAGFTKLLGPKTCNKSCLKDKCPTGTTCQAPMSFCQ